MEKHKYLRWMDGRMDGWTNGTWMDGWIHRNGKTINTLDGWTNGHTTEWMGGWVDRHKNTEMDG